MFYYEREVEDIMNRKINILKCKILIILKSLLVCLK